MNGADDEVPVWTSCRHARCARSGRAEPVLHVHVVHAAAGPVVELWTYFPDSQTSHLPLPALRGFHHDDWEGLMVAFATDGSIRGARASAHSGFNGASPWWEQAADDWAPTPVSSTARAAPTPRLPAHDSTSPATPGTGTSPRSSRGVPPGRRRPGRAARPRFDPEVAPPWEKAAWRNPGTRHTSAGGAGPSRIAAAARVWAKAYALGAW